MRAQGYVTAYGPRYLTCTITYCVGAGCSCARAPPQPAALLPARPPASPLSDAASVVQAFTLAQLQAALAAATPGAATTVQLKRSVLIAGAELRVQPGAAVAIIGDGASCAAAAAASGAAPYYDCACPWLGAPWPRPSPGRCPAQPP